MSIVERLRVIAKAISEEDWRELSMRVPAEPERDADLVVMKAADLIEQQAERIKELEAEIGIGHLQCIADRQKYKQELAALHKRIDDSHVHDKRFRMTFSGVQEISLICREDLK